MKKSLFRKPSVSASGNKEFPDGNYLEANASVFGLAGVILGAFVNIYWLILPVIVLIFLFQHAIQGWCPPLPIFRRFNIRTQKEIDKEIFALKIMRGDFENMNNNSVEDIVYIIGKRLSSMASIFAKKLIN